MIPPHTKDTIVRRLMLDTSVAIAEALEANRDHRREDVETALRRVLPNLDRYVSASLAVRP